jgi:predicted MFS family arabinose efflux permease
VAGHVLGRRPAEFDLDGGVGSFVGRQRPGEGEEGLRRQPYGAPSPAGGLGDRSPPRVELAQRAFDVIAEEFIARAVGFSFLLPLYSKASGLSTEEYGFLFALQNLTPIVALVPVLALARRGWDRRLMMIGPSLGLLGMVTLIAARDSPIWVWMIGVILSGGSSATYWTLGDPLLAEATSAESGPRAYALKWLFFTLGSSIGALVAGAVPDALQEFGGTSERDGYWAMLFGFAVLDASQIRIFRMAPIRSLRRHTA